MTTNELTPDAMTPTTGRVLVRRHRPDGEERRTASGIIIPASAKDRGQTFVGDVVAVGPGAFNRDGSRRPASCSPGDRVLYQKLAGVDFDLHGVKHEMLSEDEVLAVVEAS